MPELKTIPDDYLDADIVSDDIPPKKSIVIDTSVADIVPDDAPTTTETAQVTATKKEIMPKSGSLMVDRDNISKTVMGKMKERRIGGGQRVGDDEVKRTSLFKTDATTEKTTDTKQAVATNEPMVAEAKVTQPASEVKTPTVTTPKTDTVVVSKDISTLPAVADDIDESGLTLVDQEKQHLLSIEAHSRKLIEETFINTDIKLQKDDPLIQWFIGSQNILIDVAKRVADTVLKVMVEELENARLTQQTKYDEEARQAKYQANLVNEVFKQNVNELRQLSTALDERKEVLLAEVWAKTDQRMIEHFTKLINDNLSKGINDGVKQVIGNMAKNANSTVNNERMLNKGMIKGGAIGLGIGLAVGVFMVILLLVLK